MLSWRDGGKQASAYHSSTKMERRREENAGPRFGDDGEGVGMCKRGVQGLESAGKMVEESHKGGTSGLDHRVHNAGEFGGLIRGEGGDARLEEEEKKGGRWGSTEVEGS